MATALHLLLAEDSAADAALLVRRLQLADYAVVAERVETLAAMQAALDAQHWDLILADHRMPSFSAGAVLDLLRQRGMTIPVIVVSGVLSDEVAAQYMKQGAADYLLKDRLGRLGDAVHRALAAQRLRTQAQREHVPATYGMDHVLIVDADLTMHYVSPSFERVLGRGPGSLLGLPLVAHVHGDDQAGVRSALEQCRQGMSSAALPVFRVQHADGSARMLQGTVVNGLEELAVAGLLITVHDVTVPHPLEQTVRAQAGGAGISSLANRSLVEAALAAAVINGGSQPAPACLLIIQLDGVSDALLSQGHAVADPAFEQAVTRIETLRRSGDTLGRLSIVQLALVLPGMRQASALWAARKMLMALAPPAMVDHEAVSLRATIGIALSPDHGRDPDVLIRAATVALAAAAHSPDGSSIYTAAHTRHIAERRKLAESLRHAVEGNQLVLHYQPQVDLSHGSGRVYGVEALVRWNHPLHGLLGPDQFIGVAEQQGQIEAITRWTLQEALRQCQSWQARGLYLRVAVNLSIRSVPDLTLPATIARLLHQYTIDPHALGLEITESALMVDKARALSVLNQIAAQGVQLSIDDFGTGYASLEYVRVMPVSELKIDRSFIRELCTSTQDQAIVESLIALGRKLGLTVVAEGVEDHRTLSLLRSLGCAHIQGYYFSRPLPPTEFKHWLDRSPWGLQQVVQ